MVGYSVLILLFGAATRSGLLLALAVPVPGQELVDAPGGIVRRFCNRVRRSASQACGSTSLNLAVLDQRVDCSSAMTDLVGAGEGKSLRPVAMGRISRSVRVLPFACTGTVISSACV
jgi:hypothetical protein